MGRHYRRRNIKRYGWKGIIVGWFVALGIIFALALLGSIANTLLF